MDVNRQFLYCRFAKSCLPGRHHAVTRPAYLRRDLGGFRTVEPDGVRKIRRTQLWIALAGLAMAGRAVLGEDLGPGIRNVAAGRQRQHVLHYGVDLIADQYVSECRQFRDPRLVVACKADATSERVAEILMRTDPKPFND